MATEQDTAVVFFRNEPVAVTHVEDVKPADCGLADESWFIGRLPDGRWYVWSDAGSPTKHHEEIVATEADARLYWEGAAEAYRQV